MIVFIFSGDRFSSAMRSALAAAEERPRLQRNPSKQASNV